MDAVDLQDLIIKHKLNLSDIVKGTYHYRDISSVAMSKTFQAKFHSINVESVFCVSLPAKHFSLGICVRGNTDITDTGKFPYGYRGSL